MRFRLYVLAVLSVLLMAACAPPPNLRDESMLKDRSLITDDPCAAPCWHNIIPGETSWRDMMIAIEDDPQFDKAEEIKDENSDARLVNFAIKDGGGCCRIFSSLDGKTVGYILAQLAPGQITLGEVLEKYGDPRYAAGDNVADDQALISLIYPDIPVIVYVFAAGVANGELTEASEVIAVMYLQPADIEELVTNNNLYAWEGYVKLSDWLDGNFDYKAGSTEEAADSTAEAEPNSTAEAEQSE